MVDGLSRTNNEQSAALTAQNKVPTQQSKKGLSTTTKVAGVFGGIAAVGFVAFAVLGCMAGPVGAYGFMYGGAVGAVGLVGLGVTGAVAGVRALLDRQKSNNKEAELSDSVLVDNSNLSGRIN